MASIATVVLTPTKTAEPEQDELYPQLADRSQQQQQQQQGQTQEQTTQPEPQAATGGAGQRAGGGRNAQKSNVNRQQSAQDQLKDLTNQRDQLQSKANKTPADKAQLDKLNKAINRQRDRLKKSENHSRKVKGTS